MFKHFVILAITAAIIIFAPRVKPYFADHPYLAILLMLAGMILAILGTMDQKGKN